MNSVAKYFSFLTHETRYPFALRLFSLGVYGWFIFMAVSMWDVRHLIWGTDTVLMRFVGDSSPTTNFAYALMYQHSLFPIVYYPHILAALISMFQFRWTFVFRIITWITGIMLFYAGVNVYNSSFLMMLLFSFYLIPVDTRAKSELNILFNQLSYAAIIVQVCLIYLLSALYKLSGEMWINGEAIYYTLELSRFSREWIMESGITKSTLLMQAANYFVLGYQLLFPLAIFIGRIRKIFLVAGITLHLAIGMLMGLWDFSTAMLISYFIFIRK